MIRIPTLLPASFDARALNVAISAGINATLGLTCLLADPRSFSSASYAALRDDPGGLTGWSWGLVVAAVLIVVGLAVGQVQARVALLIVAVVHVFLTVGFIEAVWDSADASPWGWVWFGAFAIRLVGQAVGFRDLSSTSSSPVGPAR